MNIFQTTPIKRLKRNVFNLSHEFDFTMKMGKIVPIMCEEVVPGDSFRISTEFLIRFSPLIAPVMSRVNVFTQFYFVPARLLMDEFEDFITGGEDGTATPRKPFVAYDKLAEYGLLKVGSLADYMGIPPHSMINGSQSSYQSEPIDVLPFRAYQLVYNEYWRNENLQDEVLIRKTSGSIDYDEIHSIFTLRDHNWEKDYFTSALPWTQRGPDVRLPLTGDADVVNDITQATRFTTTNGSSISSNPANIQGAKDSDNSVNLTADNLELALGNSDGSTSLKADMSSVTSATINELRRAIQLQRWLETNARTGSRYIEQILAHFGIRSSDARLQRPEFLGGARTPISISEVVQTSASQTESGQTPDISPQGNMAGHGLSIGSTHSFKRFFEEHGFVIGVMFIQPRTSYMQGLPRMFSRFDKFDYLWPEFAHLGEQPVYNKEIFLKPGANVGNDGVFGYQSRYAEYKYQPNRVAGDFRDSLSFWHMGRIFDDRPGLNSNFITANPTTRIFAVEDEDVDKIYVQLFHNFKAIRPLSKYGVPKI